MIRGDGAALLRRKAGRAGGVHCGELWGDLIVASQYLKELMRKMKSDCLFTKGWRDRTTGEWIQTEGEERYPKEGTRRW